MRNADYFRNKNVAVVGLARSGLACANLLFELGAAVAVTDNRDNEDIRLNAAKLKSADIEVQLGSHTRDFLKGRDLVVVSPGVLVNAPPVIWAREFGVPVISELEFAWKLCPAYVIAITGSNGKTTVTTLIGKVLEASGRQVFVCGNIGNPFAQEVARMKEGDFVSLEVSSFQLEHIQDFKPNIAVMLNFSRNHLDRHRDMQEYLEAKKRIFKNQDSRDYLVLNYEDQVLREIANQARSNVVYFSRKKGLNPNQAAVLAITPILGIEEDVAQKVFSGFKGISHRMEFVGEKKGVRFINDSKATSVESAIWALESIDTPVVLIAGGKHKGLDYAGLLAAAINKVREVVALGEAKEIIWSALNKSIPVERVGSFKDAVQVAYSKARPGDTVLLSPMCSSFDMFSGFEERGEVFKKIVQDLLKEQ